MANHRPKPMMGAKKYDRAFLKCTIGKCDEVFFVSKATTPAKRMCAKHFAALEDEVPTAQELFALLKS